MTRKNIPKTNTQGQIESRLRWSRLQMRGLQALRLPVHKHVGYQSSYPKERVILELH